MAANIQLRPVTPADIPIFHGHHADVEARRLAAFSAPLDADGFARRWDALLGDGGVRVRTIDCAGETAGYVAHFIQFGKPSISYWLGREHWGRGIATAAVKAFLATIETRPIFARTAADNPASVRVLQKAGFEIVGRERSFAAARGTEIEELILRLGRHQAGGAASAPPI